jgi:hypothetical protein
MLAVRLRLGEYSDHRLVRELPDVVSHTSVRGSRMLPQKATRCKTFRVESGASTRSSSAEASTRLALPGGKLRDCVEHARKK